MITMKPEHKNLCKFINGSLMDIKGLDTVMMCGSLIGRPSYFGGYSTLDDAVRDERFVKFVQEHTKFSGVRDYISWRYITRLQCRASGLMQLQKVDSDILDLLERVLCDFDGIRVEQTKNHSMRTEFYINDSNGVSLLCDVMYDRTTYLYSLIRTVCKRRVRYDEIRVRLSK